MISGTNKLKRKKYVLWIYDFSLTELKKKKYSGIMSFDKILKYNMEENFFNHKRVICLDLKNIFVLN
jgi:hypothetical protein